MGLRCVVKLLKGLVLVGLITGGEVFAAGELMVYSARKEHLIQPVFKAFEAETGIKVKYLTDKAPALLAKLVSEGKRTPADILVTVDAGNLWHAANAGVLAPLNSKTLAENIPAHLKDPKNRWFGFSVRARIIVFAKDRVDPAELGGYADLAAPKWKGRLCLRTAKKVYNQSLVAMLMAQYGDKVTEERIVSGWVSNLATEVFSNDTSLINAIAAGESVANGRCDVGIVNSYYFGRLQKKDPSINAALYFPTEAQGGVHVNVSGAGLVKHSRNRDNAVKLLEWLATPTAQKLFADENLEYPANPVVQPAPLVQAWEKSISPSELNLGEAGERQAAAIRLMDRVSYH